MNELNPILLVEDSSNDIELTLAALQESHLANRVIVLRDGNEALRYLGDLAEAGYGAYPAVVLIDIKMPKINGIELLQMIKSNPSLKHIPVVMLTSSREVSDMTQCYDLGANGYVVKPVEYGEFFEVVKTVGRFWAVVNEPPEQVKGKEGKGAALATRPV